MRFILPIVTVGVLFGFATLASAQKSAPVSANSETRMLNEKVDAQSKKIDELSRQLAALTRLVEAKQNAGRREGAVTNSWQKPIMETASKPEHAQHIQRAKLANGQATTTHVVTKGETLTAIAHQYNVSVADLKKTNKIVDERRLQIGRTLIIPQTKKTKIQPINTTNPNQ